MERAELIAALEELLSAERAGAQVAALTRSEVEAPAAKDLMTVVQRDEARWCKMLIESIERLGATPSTEVGAFVGKAMAIADHDERLAFLNKGQDWVVRRLDRLMPHVVDNERLHGDLAEMRRLHVVNIEATDTFLKTRQA